MPKPNKYDQPRHVEIYNIKGVVKRTEKAVVMVLDAGSVIYEFHFGDPTQLMNFFVLMIDDMAKVFPDFEASKLWLDDTFK